MDMKERISHVIEVAENNVELFDGIAIEFFTFGEDNVIDGNYLADVRNFVNNASANNGVIADLSSITDEHILACFLDYAMTEGECIGTVSSELKDAFEKAVDLVEEDREYILSEEYAILGA
jgi:hypothetical protein